MAYEVHTNQICGGFENIWTLDDEPETFKTAQDAQNSIDDFLIDMIIENMDYDREDYKVFNNKTNEYILLT